MYILYTFYSTSVLKPKPDPMGWLVQLVGPLTDLFSRPVNPPNHILCKTTLNRLKRRLDRWIRWNCYQSKLFQWWCNSAEMENETWMLKFEHRWGGIVLPDRLYTTTRPSNWFNKDCKQIYIYKNCIKMIEEVLENMQNI